MALRLARRGKPTGEKSSSLQGDDLSDEKHSKQSSLFRPVTMLLGLALIVYALSTTTTTSMGFTSASDSKDDTPKTSSIQSNNQNNDDIATLRQAARQKYENCTISYQPPPPRTDEKDWRKPLWVPSLPASGGAGPSKKGDLMKALIDSVTGLDKGTKNYHMSMRNRLRRCRGISETAACTQGHPYVSIGPEGQTNNFQPSVIMAIRNPRDAFPGGFTDKGIAYHNAVGQPPERNWRKARDEYYKGAVKTWKDMIEWWTTNDYYHVALFIPFERLLHPTTGPDLVQRLADVYREAGFEVAPPSDMPCVWYNAVKSEWKRQDALTEYVPGYRVAQRDYLLSELQPFLEKLETQENPKYSKEDLVGIVRGYYNDIRDNTRIDEAAIKEEKEEKR
jgi:hypothetical protein